MAEDIEIKAPADPLYKYVPIPTLLAILRGTIRFTQPSAFNDPFELLPEIIIPNGEPEQRINVAFDLGAPRRSEAAPKDGTIPVGCTSSDPMSRDIVHQLNQSIGMLCLSRARNSLPMWSHYADQYSGAVIEFDGSHEFLRSHFDVEYRDARPRWDISQYRQDRPIPLSELYTKSSHWAYEREVRLARRLDECREVATDRRGFPIFVAEVPSAAIKSVILGERTPVAEQRVIFSLVQDTAIGLWLAAVSHAGYEFREERIKFNVPLSQMMPMVSPRTAHIFSEMTGQFGELARWMIEKHPASKTVNKTV